MADEADEGPPKSGTGKFFYKNGATYEGEWTILEPEGPPPVEAKKGKGAPPPPAEEETAPPKRVRHGKGIYIHGDYSYDGSWSEDRMHGEGKFCFASKAEYKGEWANDQYNGKGKFTFPDGSCYDGEWQDGTMHGRGTYCDKSGHRWAGQFFNGSGPGLTCQL